MHGCSDRSGEEMCVWGESAFHNLYVRIQNAVCRMEIFLRYVFVWYQKSKQASSEKRTHRNTDKYFHEGERANQIARRKKINIPTAYCAHNTMIRKKTSHCPVKGIEYERRKHLIKYIKMQITCMCTCTYGFNFFAFFLISLITPRTIRKETERSHKLKEFIN
jgi:hypothetical protein